MQLMNLLCSNIMSHLNFVGSSSILKRFTFYCVWHNSNFEYGESYRTDAVAGTLEFCAQREVYSMLAIMMTAHISCVRKMYTLGNARGPANLSYIYTTPVQTQIEWGGRIGNGGMNVMRITVKLIDCVGCVPISHLILSICSAIPFSTYVE